MLLLLNISFYIKFRVDISSSCADPEEGSRGSGPPTDTLRNHKAIAPLSNIVRKKIRKRRLLKKVQAFCEEKVLRCLLGVFWYAESKN